MTRSELAWSLAPAGMEFAPAMIAADGVATSTLTTHVRNALGPTIAGASVTFATTGVPSTLSATPASVTADGNATSTLTLSVRDALGAVLPNVAVTWSSTGSANSFSATSTTTNALGQTTVTLASTQVESKIITTTFAGNSLTTTVVFTPGTAVVINSNFTIDTSSAYADGSTPIHLTLVVRDARNNPVPNVAYTFTSTQGGDNFAPTPSGVTDGNGLALASVTSTVAGNATLGVTTVITLPAYPVTFIPGPPTVANSTFTVNPNMLDTRSNVQGNVALTLRDDEPWVRPVGHS